MRSHRLHSTVLLAAAAWLSVLLVACGGTASAPAATAGPYQPIGQPVGGDSTSGEKPADGQAPNDLPINDTSYIVRTGSLDIEVNAMPATLQQAQALITGLGGYIAGSKESNDPNAQYASITYRVPVERWYDALNGLRALGTRVLGENTEAADVTADVVDLDARLTNLHAAETQYQGIMAQAKTIDDVLKVQKVLNDTRGQIEQLQAQRDNLANRAALATLTVNWQVPTTATSVANQGWDLGREVDHAFAALVTFTQGLATLAIWLAVAFLPILLPVVLIGFVGYRIIRRRSKRVRMEAQTPAGG
jgi:Domain of unknown function (DUF4349)